MIIDLDKKALISMVCGVTPNFSLFNDPIVEKCGKYNDSYGTWTWDFKELNKLSEESLYDLYNKCINSFN